MVASAHRNVCYMRLSKAQIKKKHTHRDISKGCPDHEVEDPGLQLKDLRWRVNHPNCGQDKEEDGRKEGQEGFVQAAVFQSFTAMSPAKLKRVMGSVTWVKQHHCTFINTH